MKSIFEKLKHLTTKAECTRKDCGKTQRATKIPVVSVWATEDKRGEPANFVFEVLRVCPPCAPKLTLDDFINADGRRQISETFLKVGKETPVWSTAVLKWRDK